MASAAGVKKHHDGVGLAGVRLTLVEDLRIDVSNQCGENTFNTVYAEVDYLLSLSERWKLRVGAQITDQRAVGDALAARTNEKYWSAQAGGARLQLGYRELTLSGAFSITASGNNIRSPWGSYPGYLTLIDKDFDRAGEKALLFGLAYDFSRAVTPGLSAFTNLAWGWDAITVDYHLPWLAPTFLRGLWFRARAVIIDQEHARQLDYQFRLSVNWERNLI